ncbi:hypothetical protein SS50377_21133 [Spironucleus salmonicida]|uniref:Uncharacterized protein n=1 Tax=Spironucleus salmonicida TaxID=348837 RepID=A0A9P8M0T6_9EUKA|nr:hypothetical protein SS50377_21133 [Spironucleus salmonicida]
MWSCKTESFALMINYILPADVVTEKSNGTFACDFKHFTESIDRSLIDGSEMRNSQFILMVLIQLLAQLFRSLSGIFTKSSDNLIKFSYTELSYGKVKGAIFYLKATLSTISQTVLMYGCSIFVKFV